MYFKMQILKFHSKPFNFHPFKVGLYFNLKLYFSLLFISLDLFQFIFLIIIPVIMQLSYKEYAEKHFPECGTQSYLPFN